jgi:pimeloyl-ACP methyl ester carboxylesterase
MRRTMLTFLALAVLVYVGLCIALYIFQRSMIYFPQPRSAGPSVATIAIRAGDHEVVVTTRAHVGADALIYFGGNAEDVSSNLPDLSRAFPEHAVYLLHYRGYGGSGGTPSEAALFADALALFDRIHAEHPNVAVIGRSLGSGVAVHLASVRPVARLVLVTPYDSLEDIAAGRFPIFPVRWLLRDKFESRKYAPQVSAPTLLIGAEHDEVVPLRSAELLATRFRPGVATLVVLPGTGHNTISEHPRYLPLLRGASQGPADSPPRSR